MSSNNIVDYFEKSDDGDTVSIQGKVQKDLHVATVNKMREHKADGKKVTWDSFLAAACKAFIAQPVSKKRVP